MLDKDRLAPLENAEYGTFRRLLGMGSSKMWRESETNDNRELRKIRKWPWFLVPKNR